MKKGILILSILIIIFSILCIIKENKKEIIKTNHEIEKSPYKKFNFYKQENQKRYEIYKENNPNLNNKDIVLRVNIGLDNSFYTNTNEVKEFNTLMLINKYNHIAKDFTPNNLVKVEEFAKDGMQLVEECKNAFIKMARDAKEQGYNIRAISTYRTIEYQENLYNNYVKKDGINKADTYSARPTYSEHHTGLAIDIDNIKLSFNNFENTKEFAWMIDNAYKYGFILRYPKDSSITGYIYEPWHYRYVGVDVARYIKNNNITFEEYYYEFIDK
jgi:D-alanyl-D-alanine carboxypeptidase